MIFFSCKIKGELCERGRHCTYSGYDHVFTPTQPYPTLPRKQIWVRFCSLQYIAQSDLIDASPQILPPFCVVLTCNHRTLTSHSEPFFDKHSLKQSKSILLISNQKIAKTLTSTVLRKISRQRYVMLLSNYIDKNRRLNHSLENGCYHQLAIVPLTVLGLNTKSFNPWAHGIYSPKIYLCNNDFPFIWVPSYRTSGRLDKIQ